MARLLSEEELREREKMADRAERQREAELQMARAGHYAPGMSMRDINALENEVKREKLIATKGNEDQWRYRTLGRMMSQSERRSAEMMAMGVSDKERFVADNAFRNRELRTREREARYKAQGMKDQGATAAEQNAGAVKYKADKDVIIGQNRAEADKEIAKENMRAAEQRALMEQQGREKVATITANGRTQQETIKASGAMDRANIAAQSQEKIAMERTKAIREAAGIKANATREEAIAHIIGAAAAHMTKQQIDRIMKAYNY